MGETWDAKVVYEVKGKMTFRVTYEWLGENPEKVGQISGLLQDAINKFTAANTSVKIG